MKDWFDAKEALASGEAQPVAFYCIDAADLTRRIASCFTSSLDANPLAVAATGEDWEGDYTQIRSAMRTGNPLLVASFLRDHASVLTTLGRALDPTDTRTWHLVWGRKGRGRPRRASLAQPDPRQLGHVCGMDAKIVLLIAKHLEKRHWDRGGLPLTVRHQRSPVQRGWPPTGDAWLHEVKFDGWRVQLHKNKRGATVFTRTGHDYTKRYPVIAAAVAALPIQSAIIDGVLTACDCRGVPDFRALHFRNVREDELCVWTFDIPRRPRSGNGSCG